MPEFMPEAKLRGKTIALVVHGVTDPRGLEFFPINPELVAEGDPQTVSTKGVETTVTLELSDFLHDPPTRLQGLLVASDPKVWGKGTRAQVIDVPVKT